MTKGQTAILNMPGHVLDGAKVVFLSQSDKTGKCRVRLMEDRKTWSVGDELNVDPSELA